MMSFLLAPQDHTAVEDCLPPMFSGHALSASLARLGITAVQADGDADATVASVARERNGMVVSRDSDLMLMETLLGSC